MGLNKDGITDCVQVGRREELRGIGFSQKDAHAHDDSWWQETYNKAIIDVKKSLNGKKPANGVKNEKVRKESISERNGKSRKESGHSLAVSVDEYDENDEEMFKEFINLVKESSATNKKKKIRK